ncbi:MAG: ribosomal protein S18-alanine N-acetyltransferase [Acidobacteria bacterium]|nr:ribosomal protein S18-alanine N-acetyltransferase [Acidobacteriota bacterium]
MLSFEKPDPPAIPEIKNIEVENFLCPWSETDYLSELDLEDSIFLAAFYRSEESQAEKTTLGFIIGRINRSDVPPSAEILNIAVRKNNQGKGLGTRLLSKFLGLVEETDVESVYLEARVSNKKALSLYEKHHFVRVGIRKNLFRNPDEDGVILCRHSTKEKS